MSTPAAVREDTSAMALRPTAFEVTSESDPSKTYHVQLASCDCKDFRYRRTTMANPFCKHLVRAYEEAGWHFPEATEGLTTGETKALLLKHGAYNIHGIQTAMKHARSLGTDIITLSEGQALVEYGSETRRYSVGLPA